MTSSPVPELALSAYIQGGEARAAFSRDLFAALQRFGFVIIREHTVAPALLERAYGLCAELFALPEKDKRGCVGGPRGYAPLGTEHARDRAAADLKEFWQIGPERPKHGPAPPNLWPPALLGLRETFLALFAALQESGAMLLSALTPGLGVPSDFFAARLEGHNSVLRLLHYPPVPADVDPASTRSAEHEDINLLTLLPGPRGPGLEILDRDGTWLTIDAGPHDLIVDSGDMMAVLTNDVIPATTHRVLRPADAGQSRYSMPFFMHPDPYVVLSCLPSCQGSGVRHAETTAGEFLETRLREIGLVRG